MEVNKVYHGDCLDVLKILPENSVDSICCDPPYELGFMGKSWDNTGIANNVEMWKECLRVLKPGGHLLAFSGTRTYHRMASAIEDAGFEVRDMIEWVYGCLSEDTEILTESGYKPLHKLTQYDRIGVYDITNNIYKWERPQRYSIYKVHQDTAYRIKSDYTDQIVSRNHRCLVEREGKLVFIQAEELNEVEYMPTLSEDFYSLHKNSNRKLLLKELLWKGKRLAQKVFSKWTGNKKSEERIEVRKEPSLERWSNLLEETRKLQADKICEVSEGVFTDGEKRWICNGTSFDNGSILGDMFRENPSSASYQSRPTGQPTGKPDVISIKQGTQITRRARVTKIEYSGIIFCPTVSTGAFVARRNGQVFITGNSGFPKSLNIGKAVDKLQGNEREVTGIAKRTGKEAGTYGAMAGNNTETKGTSEWEGWGTALKPAHESIAVAQKPFDSRSDIDYTISICQTLFAQIVKKSSELSLSEKTQQSIAQWTAEKNINTLEDLSEVMDMLQSELETNLNLNIVSSWLNILGEIWGAMSMFTTETKGSLTTELKILQSLEWENIFQNITQVKNNQTDGYSANVLNVENLLNAVKLKLKYILTHSAQENAISQANKLNFAPNYEPICMARKPLAEKTVAENCLKWGTGGINIDDSRVEADIKNDPNYRPNASQHKGHGSSFSIQGDGQRSKEDLPDEGFHNSLGRFPANLIHDGSEEVRDTMMQDYQDPSRFFKSIIYQAKASKAERNKGCEELEEKEKKTLGSFGDQSEFDCPDGANRVGNKGTSINRNNHPTVKPIALMEYLIKMVTPKGGVVLDPFAGSGSTLVAAKQNGFQYIGIEMTEEYIPIIEARLK